jgi:hypothetical protein
MKLLLAAAGLAALAASPAFADCAYPHAPSHLPDGSVATLAQMLTAQKAVQTYNTRMMTYLHCIKQQQDHTIVKASTKLTKKQIAKMEEMEIQKNNAAVDQLKSVANQFNAQVKIFEAKHHKKSN